MKPSELYNKVKQQAEPFAIASWKFLRAEFSDKKNLVRFALAAVAMIITSQLLPERKIEIAGFGITLFLLISYIATMICAPHVIAKAKLPINTYTYGIHLFFSNLLLLWFYDWILYYFETESVVWIIIYSAILAVFNCIINDLLNDEAN